jgi:hypothetical protein
LVLLEYTHVCTVGARGIWRRRGGRLDVLHSVRFVRGARDWEEANGRAGVRTERGIYGVDGRGVWGGASTGFDVGDRAWLVVAISVWLEDNTRLCGVVLKVVRLAEGNLVSGEGRQGGSEGAATSEHGCACRNGA